MLCPAGCLRFTLKRQKYYNFTIYQVILRITFHYNSDHTTMSLFYPDVGADIR